jgi:hypothetical protein
MSNLNRKVKTLLTDIRVQGLPKTLRYARSLLRDSCKAYLDASFDRKYHTDTAGYINLSDLTIVGNTSIEECIYYEPLAEAIFSRLFDAVSDLAYESYTFVDYGSGKGRILLLAAQYPFRRIVGVEFARELHEIALENFKSYSNPKQRCFDLQSICMDAAEYIPPNEPCVLMLFSPFKLTLLRKVIENVKRSVKEKPRSVYIIYYATLPNCIEYITQCGIPCCEVRIRHSIRERNSGRRAFVLYETGS